MMIAQSTGRSAVLAVRGSHQSRPHQSRSQQITPRARVREPELCVHIFRVGAGPLRVLFLQPGQRRPLYQTGRLSNLELWSPKRSLRCGWQCPGITHLDRGRMLPQQVRRFADSMQKRRLDVPAVGEAEGTAGCVLDDFEDGRWQLHNIIRSI